MSILYDAQFSIKALLHEAPGLFVLTPTKARSETISRLSEVSVISYRKASVSHDRNITCFCDFVISKKSRTRKYLKFQKFHLISNRKFRGNWIYTTLNLPPIDRNNHSCEFFPREAEPASLVEDGGWSSKCIPFPGQIFARIYFRDGRRSVGVFSWNNHNMEGRICKLESLEIKDLNVIERHDGNTQISIWP